MKNKLTLLTAVILSSVAFGSQAHANEVETTVTSTEPTSAVTSTETATVANSTETTIETTVANTTEATTEATTESVTPTTTESNSQVTKTGTEIHITNPKVTIDQSEGQGKYNGFKVKYEYLHILL